MTSHDKAIRSLVQAIRQLMAPFEQRRGFHGELEFLKGYPRIHP